MLKYITDAGDAVDEQQHHAGAREIIHSLPQALVLEILHTLDLI